MFEKYQKQSARFFKEHKELTPKEAELLDWGTGLGEEAGEVLSVLKHGIFHHEGVDKMKLAKELGDVMWYVAALCTANDMSLAAVAELNASKLAHRYHDEGYDDASSALRHDAEECFEETFLYKNLEAKILHTPAPLNVIFVGPDGAGKTTIAKKVAEALWPEGFAYQKCNFVGEDKPRLCHTLLNSRANILYDRFYYPDDIIYSRIIHEHTSEEPMDWNTEYWKAYNGVVDKLCELNTVFFLVTASPETLVTRADKWRDDYVTVEDLPKIQALYDRWARFLETLPIIRFDLDTTETSVEDNVKFCLDCIRKAQAVFAGQDPDTYLSAESAEENNPECEEESENGKSGSDV